ncbi:uncharacterized protein [Amphiura filiformis]|uniref:uncharacterized protein n=1 Tax=Amphiura filiformis TaxID=82378 RepID=UPI003B218F8A
MRYSILGNHSNGEYNLQITNVRNSDEATYECVYYEGHADPELIKHSRRGALLAIGRPPDPGYPLCSMSPSTGVLPLMNVTFTCTTRGGNPMGKVRWYTGTKWIGKWGLNGTIRHTRFLTANDVGIVLSCQEDHPSRPRYPRKCQVNPLTALGISITPGPQVSVLTGNNMIFSCVPNKKENYGYIWTINGHPVVRSPYIFPFGNSGEKLRLIGLTMDMNRARVSCQGTDINGYTTFAHSLITVVDNVPPTLPPTTPAPTIPPWRPNPRPRPVPPRSNPRLNPNSNPPPGNPVPPTLPPRHRPVPPRSTWNPNRPPKSRRNPRPLEDPRMGEPSKNSVKATIVGAAVTGIAIGVIIAFIAMYTRSRNNNRRTRSGEGSTVKYYNHSGSPW